MQSGRKWMIVGLVTSVALNLALAGFVGGRLLEPQMAPPMDPSLALFPALRELPEARRAELRELMREQFRQARPALRRMRDAQRAIEDALTADSYSDATLAAALADFRQALLATQEGSHAALVHLVQSLTPEERKLLANAMRHGPRPPFPMPGGGMRPHAPPEAPTP